MSDHQALDMTGLQHASEVSHVTEHKTKYTYWYCNVIRVAGTALPEHVVCSVR
jgi:hypothetical protein